MHVNVKRFVVMIFMEIMVMVMMIRAMMVMMIRAMMVMMMRAMMVMMMRAMMVMIIRMMMCDKSYLILSYIFMVYLSLIKFEINMYSFSSSILDIHLLVFKAQQKRDRNNSSKSSRSKSQRSNQRGSIIVGISNPKALDKLSAFNSALFVSPFRRHLSTSIEDDIFLGMIVASMLMIMMMMMIMMMVI